MVLSPALRTNGLRNNQLILFVLVVFSVFVDMMTGFFRSQNYLGLSSLGLYFRAAIMIPAIYCLLNVRCVALKLFLFLAAFVFLFSNMIWASESEVYSFRYELISGMKLMFPWLVTAIILYLHQKSPIDAEQLFSLMAWAGVLGAASIILSSIWDVGNLTYGKWSYGVKGFFTAQNAIGLTFCMALAAAVALLMHRRRISDLVLSLVIVAGAMLLGTRTGFIGPFIVILGFFLAALLGRFLSPRRSGQGSTHTGIAAMLFILMCTAAVTVLTRYDSRFLVGKLERLAEETPRSELEAAGSQRLTSRATLMTLFGEGRLAFGKNVAEILGVERRKSSIDGFESRWDSGKMDFSIRITENDIVDTLGYYGVVLAGITYCGYLFLCWLAVRKTLHDWNVLNVGIVIILTVYLGHSSFAGHAIYNAMVGTMISPVMFLLLRDVRWAGETRAYQINESNAG